MVTLEARRSSAISAGLLIMRHPEVTGVALVTVAAGTAFAMLSAKTNGVVSSMPILPVRRPASFRPKAARAYGAFVFLPGVDVRARYRSGGDLFPRAILFEARADEESIAARRNDHHEQALAIAPARAAEIVERRAAGQTNGGDLVLHHQLLRAFDAGAAFGG